MNISLVSGIYVRLSTLGLVMNVNFGALRLS